MNNQIRRLATAGLVDRKKPINFKFNNKHHQGYEGDTLASALLANGVEVLSRSFKYHRRRGIQGAGIEDATSIVQILGVDDASNILATQQPLYEGLEARSVNCWPSVNFDMGAALSLLSPVLPSGFYYKTFMWPHWHLFEPIIRRAAGFGKAPVNVSAKPYESRFGHCDVLVVGAGPTGLAAALAAGRTGAKVLIADETLAAGGCLNWSSADIDGVSAAQWIESAVAELDAMENVERLQNTTVWGYLEGNCLTLIERQPQPSVLAQRNRKVWAKQVIAAGGAIERPIIFNNNDLPGVMFSSAVRAYLGRYGVAVGQRAVLFCNNDCAYQTAFDLHKAGSTVLAVVDVRKSCNPELSEKLSQLDIKQYSGYVVTGATGSKHVTGVEIESRTSQQTVSLSCDLICVSGGWNPAVHMHSQSRGTIRYSQEIEGFVPDKAMQACRSAGGANGDFNLTDCLTNGAKAGLGAARDSGFSGQASKAFEVTVDIQPTYNIEALWTTQQDDSRSKAFADIAGDVTIADLHLAVREGYSKIEHLKRYTTAGMGFDQGKTGNVNVIGVIANLLGKPLDEVGTTTFRSPYSLIEFGAIAGSRRDMSVRAYRHTAITEEHKRCKAIMFEAGALWRRPSYYPVTPTETLEQAMYRESRSVRNGAGMYDGSPLGKFELKGPDVVELLNLMYTNAWDSLKVGHGRYGVMMTEDAIMFDDGVTFRLDEHRYLMSGATGNAPALEAKLDRLLNVERRDLNVLVTPMTSQWANVTVCGPKAREVLQAMDTDIDLDPEKFTFMQFREGQLAGMPVRIFRVSFTGELSFEINAPRRYGAEIWRQVLKAGKPFDIAPVGSEASSLLRIEKGFISFGHEVDGVIDPIDLSLGWIVSKKKTDFIGKRAMEIRRANGRARQEIVGLLTEDASLVIPEGAPLTPDGAATDSEGFVSAAVHSVVKDRSVALALLNNGRARHGETVYARVKGQVIPAVVTNPIFYDPTGDRLKM
jgi:sarcosine oxidase subunit alpha